MTACKESNTSGRRRRSSAGPGEKSAAVDSAEPNSKGILLRLRHLFVCASFLPAPAFCQCQDFDDATILSTPVFCRCQYFVDADILSTAIILSTPIILSSIYFDAANISDFV